MGGRGSSSIPTQPGYARALKLAKENVKSEQKEIKEISQRIINSVKEQNEGIEKYASKNAEWKQKVQESTILAQQGKFEESQKKYKEGEKIYNSIPERFRR